MAGDVEGAVGGGVVDDYDFVVEVAGWGVSGCVDDGGFGLFWETVGKVLFGEGAVEEPDYDGEVAALVVLVVVLESWDAKGLCGWRGLLLGGSRCISPFCPSRPCRRRVEY